MTHQRFECVVKRSPLTTCTHAVGQENGRAVAYCPWLTKDIVLGCVQGMLCALLHIRAQVSLIERLPLFRAYFLNTKCLN